MRYPPIPFPKYALPDKLFPAAQYLQMKLKTSFAMGATALCVAVSDVLKAKYNVSRPGEQDSSMGLFAVILAGSGERKTSLARLAFAAQSEFEAYVRHCSGPQIAAYDAKAVAWKIRETSIHKQLKKAAEKGESGELHQQALEAHLAEKPVRPVLPKITMTDVTPEAISNSLTSWPSVGLIADEGAGLLNGRALQNLPLLTKAWDGDRLYVDRVDGSADAIANPRMSLLAMIQPGLFDKFLRSKGSEAHELGLFARTLITYPESTQGTRFDDGTPFPSAGMDDLTKTLVAVLKTTWDPVNGANFDRQGVPYSSEARESWFRYTNFIESHCGPSGVYGRMTAFASKMPEQVARFATMFACLRGGSLEVSTDDLRRAEVIVDYFAQEHARLFLLDPEMSPEQVDAIAVERWLAKRVVQKRTWFVKRSVVRRNGPVRDMERLLRALDWLWNENKVSYGFDRGIEMVECNPESFPLPPNGSTLHPRPLGSANRSSAL